MCSYIVAGVIVFNIVFYKAFHSFHIFVVQFLYYTQMWLDPK